MTGFQLTRTRGTAWPEPIPAEVGVGRHASIQRAKLTVRRMFYIARHSL